MGSLNELELFFHYLGPSIKSVTQLGGEVTDLLRSLGIILHQTLEFSDEGRGLKIDQNCITYFMDGPFVVKLRVFVIFKIKPKISNLKY
jgi:hypothetical protein